MGTPVTTPTSVFGLFGDEKNGNTFFMYLFIYLFFNLFSRQGISVALQPVLELALVDQGGLELTEICLPLPP